MKKNTKTDGISGLLQTIAHLRGPNGCPWDAKQTPETLKIYIQEECTELIEAISSSDTEHICEELGDVLLQIVLLSQIYSENSTFDFNDVATGINEKLIRRHPHVFKEKCDITDEELRDQWNSIKQKEKEEKKRRHNTKE